MFQACMLMRNMLNCDFERDVTKTDKTAEQTTSYGDTFTVCFSGKIERFWFYLNSSMISYPAVSVYHGFNKPPLLYGVISTNFTGGGSSS